MAAFLICHLVKPLHIGNKSFCCSIKFISSVSQKTMSNSHKPKKHHFVPECYLKNFKTGANLYTLDVRKVQKGYREKVKSNHPGKICYYEDYYKIKDEHVDSQFKLHEYEELFVETSVLKRLENKYSDLQKKIEVEHELCISEAVEISDLIIQLKIRNPYWFEHILEPRKKEWIEFAMDEIINEMQEENRFSSIPQEAKKKLCDEFKESIMNDPNYAKKIQLYSLIERERSSDRNNKSYRAAMLKGKWVLLISPPLGPYFITTDNPGFSIRENDPKVYNTAFTAGYAYHFPLSPQFCLLITDFLDEPKLYSSKDKKSISTLKIDGNRVLQINNCSIQLINRLAIGSQEWYLEEIGKLNSPNYPESNI